MAFRHAGLVVACRSHLGNRLETEFKFLQSQVSWVSSKAGYNPLNTDSNSLARDDQRSDRPDTAEAVRDGIRNMIDTAEAIGDNTKEAAETAWDSAKEGAETVKENLKDSGKPQPREDIAAARESGIEELKRRLHDRP